MKTKRAIWAGLAGLLCAIGIGLLPAATSSAAGGGKATDLYMTVFDDEGRVRGDVVKAPLQQYFTVKRYNLEFTGDGCAPLTLTTDFSVSWGRLAADVGEGLPKLELRVYKDPKIANAPNQLKLRYDFNGAQLSRVAHANGDDMTLTVNFDSVDIRAFGPDRQDTVFCTAP